MGRRLPDPDKRRIALEGLRINHYTVGDWCPDQEAQAPAEAVGLSLNVTFRPGVTGDLVLRLKTPQAVDTLIQSLLRHKRSVWPVWATIGFDIDGQAVLEQLNQVASRLARSGCRGDRLLEKLADWIEACWARPSEGGGS